MSFETALFAALLSVTGIGLFSLLIPSNWLPKGSRVRELIESNKTDQTNDQEETQVSLLEAKPLVLAFLGLSLPVFAFADLLEATTIRRDKPRLALLPALLWGAGFSLIFFLGSTLTKILGFAFMVTSLVILLTFSYLGQGFFTMRMGGLPLYRPEVYGPILSEYLAPGTGVQSSRDYPRSRFLVTLFSVLMALASPYQAYGIALLIWVLSSVALTFASINHRIDQSLEEETRMVLAIEGTNKESARCQAGMAILTAKLIKAEGQKKWDKPDEAANKSLIKDAKALVQARKIPEIQDCLKANRIEWIRTKGRLHLFCQRHNLCPRHFPETLSRDASTAGGTTDGTGTLEPTAIFDTGTTDAGTEEDF